MKSQTSLPRYVFFKLFILQITPSSSTLLFISSSGLSKYVKQNISTLFLSFSLWLKVLTLPFKEIVSPSLQSQENLLNFIFIISNYK